MDKSNELNDITASEGKFTKMPVEFRVPLEKISSKYDCLLERVKSLEDELFRRESELEDA